jgi:hypothetical protein
MSNGNRYGGALLAADVERRAPGFPVLTARPVTG